MKTKFITIHLVLSFTLMIFTFSCSKNEKDQIDHASEGVYVSGNIVHFESTNTFIKTINYLHTISRNELINWEKNIGFNKSMRSFYDDLQDPDNAEIDDRWALIPDPVLATIVNKDGIYVIGDTIHKITFDVEYLITDGNYSSLEKLESGANLKNANSNIIQIPIVRSEIKSDLKWIGWKSYEKTDICNLTDRRAQLKAWNVTYAAYASCGIRIVGRQYVKNMWGNYNWKDWYMDYAKVDGCARLTALVGTNSTGVYEFCGSDSNSDKKNVDKTIEYFAGTGVVINVFWIHADFHYEDGGCTKDWYQEFNY